MVYLLFIYENCVSSNSQRLCMKAPDTPNFWNIAKILSMKSEYSACVSLLPFGNYTLGSTLNSVTLISYFPIKGEIKSLISASISTKS